MNIEDIHNQQWYLAQYATGGKKREHLFDWLSDQHIAPWTPLVITKIKRSDKPNVFRKRVSAVFPGYFFLKANFEYHKIETIKKHSSFCDFVKFGSKISPVKSTVVEALMKVYPHPSNHPETLAELESAADIWLNKNQYRHLVQIENISHPISRISLLLDLITQSDSYGF
ncbi:transcription termination/antitermination NusG family protein [Pectobacterium atrosepticum]|uniref:transcription termination/antitermination NusG family protein n=1 Tax=Pectobacterium atrosepticum TaxID=29471 RepID=UPI00301AFE56